MRSNVQKQRLRKYLDVSARGGQLFIILFQLTSLFRYTHTVLAIYYKVSFSQLSVTQNGLRPVDTLDVHNIGSKSFKGMKLTKLTHRVCPSVCSARTNFDILYGLYVIGGHPKIVLFNCLQSAVTTWRTRKFVSWERH